MAQSTHNAEVKFATLTSESATTVFGSFRLLTATGHDSAVDSSFCFGDCPCGVPVNPYTTIESSPDESAKTGMFAIIPPDSLAAGPGLFFSCQNAGEEKSCGIPLANAISCERLLFFACLHAIMTCRMQIAYLVRWSDPAHLVDSSKDSYDFFARQLRFIHLQSCSADW